MSDTTKANLIFRCGAASYHPCLKSTPTLSWAMFYSLTFRNTEWSLAPRLIGNEWACEYLGAWRYWKWLWAVKDWMLWQLCHRNEQIVGSVCIKYILGWRVCTKSFEPRAGRVSARKSFLYLHVTILLWQWYRCAVLALLMRIPPLGFA